MYICKVVGKVVATIRNPRLGANSLILVRRLGAEEEGELLVAADPIGCGDGDTILVTKGANARLAIGDDLAPVDLAVVGIVDSFALNASAPTQAGLPIGAAADPKPSTAKPAPPPVVGKKSKPKNKK